MEEEIVGMGEGYFQNNTIIEILTQEKQGQGFPQRSQHHRFEISDMASDAWLLASPGERFKNT